MKMTQSFEQLGAEKMYLDLNAENEGALRMYEALGYEVEGRLKREILIDGQYIDLILMGKHLGLSSN